MNSRLSPGKRSTIPRPTSPGSSRSCQGTHSGASSASGGAAVFDKDHWQLFTRPSSPLYTTTVNVVQTIGEAVWWGFFGNAVTSIYSPNWLRYTAADMGSGGTPNAVLLDTVRVFVGIGNNFSYHNNSAWINVTIPGNVAPVSAFASAATLKWWVGTNGNGLYLFDNSPGPIIFTHITTAEALPRNLVNARLTDQPGVRAGRDIAQGAGSCTLRRWEAWLRDTHHRLRSEKLH